MVPLRAQTQVEKGGGVRRNKTSGVVIWFSSFPRPPVTLRWGNQAKNRSRFLMGKAPEVLLGAAWGRGGGFRAPSALIFESYLWLPGNPL